MANAQKHFGVYCSNIHSPTQPYVSFKYSCCDIRGCIQLVLSFVFTTLVHLHRQRIPYTPFQIVLIEVSQSIHLDFRFRIYRIIILHLFLHHLYSYLESKKIALFQYTEDLGINIPVIGPLLSVVTLRTPAPVLVAMSEKHALRESYE